jgi:hypothetical protein
MAKKPKNQIEIVVVKRFRDKKDHKTWYENGTVLKFDEARANNVIGRGLAELYEPDDNLGGDDNSNTNSDGQNNSDQK